MPTKNARAKKSPDKNNSAQNTFRIGKIEQKKKEEKYQKREKKKQDAFWEIFQ